MKPLKRIEHFLAKIAGDSSAKELTPKTRDEYYLNEIAENGGGSGSGGALIINVTEALSTETLDKTWQEIFDAMSNDVPCYVKKVNHSGASYSIVSNVGSGEKACDVCTIITNPSTHGIGTILYTADSISGYPSYTPSLDPLVPVIS